MAQQESFSRTQAMETAAGEAHIARLLSSIRHVAYVDAPDVPLPPDERQALLAQLGDELLGERLTLLNLPNENPRIPHERLATFDPSLGNISPHLRICWLGYSRYNHAREAILGGAPSPSNGVMSAAHGLILARYIETAAPSLPQDRIGLAASITVHELAHTEQQLGQWQCLFSRNPNPTTGYHTKWLTIHFPDLDAAGLRHSAFLLEGYCEYQRARYILDHLGYPKGFFDVSNETFPGLEVFYMRQKPATGAFVPSASAFAALTLRAFTEHDPSFADLLKASFASVAGLAALARYVDQLVPGIYDQMADLQPDDMYPTSRQISIYKRVKQALTPRRA